MPERTPPTEQPPRAPRRQRPVGARELAEFAYCAKSWAWHRDYGDPRDPRTLAALEAGRRAHAEEGRLRWQAERAVRQGRWWWVWLLLAGLALWLAFGR